MKIRKRNSCEVCGPSNPNLLYKHFIPSILNQNMIK